MNGKIIKGIGGFYYIKTADGTVYECKARGIFRKENIKPAIGDEVEIIDGFLTGHKGTISEISEDETEVTVIVSTIGREMPVSLDIKAIKKSN